MIILILYNVTRNELLFCTPQNRLNLYTGVQVAGALHPQLLGRLLRNWAESFQIETTKPGYSQEIHVNLKKS